MAGVVIALLVIIVGSIVAVAAFAATWNDHMGATTRIERKR